MDTILVTGGCGFIGSNFIRHLLAAEPDTSIVNLDRLSYAGNPQNLRDCRSHPRYRWVRGDIADNQTVDRIVRQGVTAIINFAAESHVDRSIADCTPFVHTNIVGAQVLLDAARRYRVSRFVQVSTDEVYESVGSLGRSTEDSPLHPSSPYAASKASADLMVLSYVHTHQVPAIITRCSNNYGPFQFPEKVIPFFVTRLLKDESVPVYGDGLNVRDWLHVADHCEAIRRVLRQGQVGSIYNIGSGFELTNLALTEQLLDLLGKPRSLLRFVADRPGHDRRYALDTTKIERDLGWRPRVRFNDGLRDTVRWYQEHTDWIASIECGSYQRAA